MNKAELIAAIAAAADIKKTEADQALAGFLAAVQGALATAETVSLVGFGTFSVAKRGARVGKNPRTGKQIQIAAKKVVKFKAGKNLSESLA
ncbi:MAG: DNA-binding protein HU [Deltaproteobacteria bacterium RIFOXYD12_FULL_57_12]|nr:MAG: DNA-binding protein HU [Deltaproteobacteria bacterium RIFOXYD12_FULL_57_12]